VHGPQSQQQMQAPSNDRSDLAGRKFQSICRGRTRDDLSCPLHRAIFLDGRFCAKLAASRGRCRDPALRIGPFEARALLSANAPTALGSWQVGTISRKWLSRSCCNLCVFAVIFEACLAIRSGNQIRQSDHSTPMCARFSATERFITKTSSISTSVVTANIQKQSK
jgi:hypothetical protein